MTQRLRLQLPELWCTHEKQWVYSPISSGPEKTGKSESPRSQWTLVAGKNHSSVNDWSSIAMFDTRGYEDSSRMDSTTRLVMLANEEEIRIYWNIPYDRYDGNAVDRLSRDKKNCNGWWFIRELGEIQVSCPAVLFSRENLHLILNMWKKTIAIEPAADPIAHDGSSRMVDWC